MWVRQECTLFFSVSLSNWFWFLFGFPAYKTSVTNTLYRCNDNNWCCSTGGNATSCCNDPGIENFFFNVGQADISNGSAWAPGLTLVPIAAVQTSLPTSSISAQSCPTQTVLKEVNGTTGSDGETQGEMDYSGETQTVGLAVGLGISVPLLIALSAALFLLWREKRSHQMLRQQLSGELVQPVNAVSGYGRKEPYEIYTRDGQAVKEMPTEGEMIPELQSNLFGRWVWYELSIGKNPKGNPTKGEGERSSKPEPSPIVNNSSHEHRKEARMRTNKKNIQDLVAAVRDPR